MIAYQHAKTQCAQRAEFDIFKTESLHICDVQDNGAGDMDYMTALPVGTNEGGRPRSFTTEDRGHFILLVAAETLTGRPYAASGLSGLQNLVCEGQHMCQSCVWLSNCTLQAPDQCHHNTGMRIVSRLGITSWFARGNTFTQSFSLEISQIPS